MIYVGSIAIASPVGYLYERIGFAYTYILMGGTALMFTFISLFTLSACRRQPRPGTPAEVTSPPLLHDARTVKH